MKNSTFKLVFTLGFGLICSFSAIPTFAQYQSPNNDSYQSNEKDNMSGTLGNINPMDLIHNANLDVGRSTEEFNQDSQMQIENSAAEFRRLQQEKILQQQNKTPESTEEFPQ